MTIDVAYGRVDALGLWLPVTMTESYDVVEGRDRELLRTEAKYSDYRVFQTLVRIK